MRVYELAKELGLTTKELMDTLAMLKVAVKSHSSTLTVAAEERIRTHVAATRPARGKKAAAAPSPSAAPPRRRCSGCQSLVPGRARAGWRHRTCA